MPRQGCRGVGGAGYRPGVTQTTAEAAASSAAPDDVGAPVVQDGFDALVAPLRRELLAHCYRMTGSLLDAEDALQETWLRAWRALPDFEGRSSLRTWMYRIATRVCLSHLEGRARRPLPVGLGGPPADPAVEPHPDRSVPWLEPLPDRLLWSTPDADPADRAVDVDTVRLAFVAALQHLPAQQRAVLLLRDVLAWTAAEVAQALRLSVAAVNSTLQRAHSRMATLDVPPAPAELTPHQQHLLRRYVAAFEAYDVPALVTLLAADVVWEMPPYPEWYQG
ncbi:MAG: RNA polymerase subunit sigma-70, partial [Cellulomonas sp.]|nr:RNA polymerase subunit sigma-70 [Cellulomonas sp.]